MTSQRSHVNRDSSQRNVQQCIQTFSEFKTALYSSILVMKLFAVAESYFKLKSLL